MAREFNGSTQCLSVASAVLTDYPITVAGWGYTTSDSAYQALFSLGDPTSITQRYDLGFSGHVGGDPVGLFVQYGGASNFVATTTGYSINTWHHLCAVGTAANDRWVYIDGGSKGTTTTSVAFPPPTTTKIGTANYSGGTGWLAGRAAEIGVWNAALTDAEVAILARGYSPLLVRPGNLVAYWPLIGRTSPEIDLVGGLGISLVNTPTTIAHPRTLYYPFRGFSVPGSSLAVVAHNWGTIF